MKISIFGVGYVGCVTAGCLANKGYLIIAVDPNTAKVDLINAGKATIVEKDIDKYISKGVKSQLIQATKNTKKAILESDMAIICVGTPNNSNGQLDMSNIYQVAEEIGNELSLKNIFYTIVIRSTVMPGTNKIVGNIIAEKSGKKINKDFAIVSCPEFIREGNAVDDFMNPPYTIVGSSSNKGIQIVNQLFYFIPSPFIKVDIKVAELIKFLNNSFHALKVSFGNEIGRICKKLSINSHELINLFVKDVKLNISSKYFQPGPAYGGSCLPKDLKALNVMAHDAYLNTPILRAIIKSNVEHGNYLFNMVTNYDKKSVGVYGLSFKPGTDDLRFSPNLELCEKLIGKGYYLKIFDSNVVLSQIMGQNKEILLNHLPHIEKLLYSEIEVFLKDIEILVINHPIKDIYNWKKKIDKNLIIIDLVGIDELKNHPRYEGICWE